MYAHRGLYGPNVWENSMESFRKALENEGYVGFECDVRLSLDRIPVVNHDLSLKKVYGEDVLVSDTKAAFLKKKGVPMVKEVLELLMQHRKDEQKKQIIFDIKGQSFIETVTKIMKLSKEKKVDHDQLVFLAWDSEWQDEYPKGARIYRVLESDTFTESDVEGKWQGITAPYTATKENLDSIVYASTKTQMEINLHCKDECKLKEFYATDFVKESKTKFTITVYNCSTTFGEIKSPLFFLDHFNHDIYAHTAPQDVSLHNLLVSVHKGISLSDPLKK
jgi:glycerophosphoryl diester phosphodiesterase